MWAAKWSESQYETPSGLAKTSAEFTRSRISTVTKYGMSVCFFRYEKHERTPAVRQYNLGKRLLRSGETKREERNVFEKMSRIFVGLRCASHDLRTFPSVVSSCSFLSNPEYLEVLI